MTTLAKQYREASEKIVEEKNIGRNKFLAKQSEKYNVWILYFYEFVLDKCKEETLKGKFDCVVFISAKLDFVFNQTCEKLKSDGFNLTHVLCDKSYKLTVSW